MFQLLIFSLLLVEGLKQPRIKPLNKVASVGLVPLAVAELLRG